MVSRAGWSEFGVATGPEGRATHAVSAAQRSTTSRVQRLSNNLGPPPFSGGASLPHLRHLARGIRETIRSRVAVSSSVVGDSEPLGTSAKHLWRDWLLFPPAGAESGQVLVGEWMTDEPEVDSSVESPVGVDQMRAGQ